MCFSRADAKSIQVNEIFILMPSRIWRHVLAAGLMASFCRRCMAWRFEGPKHALSRSMTVSVSWSQPRSGLRTMCAGRHDRLEFHKLLMAS